MKKKIDKNEEKGITLDQLGQMVARGFVDTNQRLDVLTREVVRLGDDIHDLKSITKSHQQMLMDHEHRIDHLELKA